MKKRFGVKRHDAEFPSFLSSNDREKLRRWMEKGSHYDIYDMYNRTKRYDHEAMRFLASKGRENLRIAEELDLSGQNWERAEYHLRLAQQYFNQVPGSHGGAIAEIDIQELHRKRGVPVDLDKLVSATRSLVEKGEMSGVTGIALLQKILPEKLVLEMIDEWVRLGEERFKG